MPAGVALAPEFGASMQPPRSRWSQIAIFRFTRWTVPTPTPIAAAILRTPGRLSFGSVARMAGRPRGASLAFRGGLASEQIRAGGVGLAPLMTATLCYFFATFPRNHKS